MFEALRTTGLELARRSGVRAVVLSGEGASFCAGLDLGALAGAGGATPLLRVTETGRSNAQDCVLVWRDLPVPVIAAVHGVAYGGGFQLALGADIRIAARDAKLSAMEIRWGLVPDMGGIALLRGLVRDDQARALVYTGPILSGEEALAAGLVTQLAEDPRAEALAMARQIAAASPSAIKAARALLSLAPDADEAAILRAERDAQTALLAGPDHAEAVQAGLQKRPPRFAD
jgi:enoyl-CoA hydratase/carnithine racemase